MGASSGDVQKERARLIDFARVMMMMMCARVTTFSSVFDSKNQKNFDPKMRKKSCSFLSPITCIFPKSTLIISHTNTQTNIMPYASESFLRTAAREGKKMWPFLAGFAFVGTAVTYSTLTITSEDKKASKFLNPGGH